MCPVLFLGTYLVIRHLYKYRLGPPFCLAYFKWQRVTLRSSIQVLSESQDDMHMTEKHPLDVLNSVTKPWRGSEVHRQALEGFMFVSHLEFMKCADFGLNLLKYLFWN